MKCHHVAALVLVVLVCQLAGVAFAGGTCDAKLVGNSYDCTISLQTGEGSFVGVETKNNCVEFITGGLSNNFDLVGDGLGLSGDLGCECEVASSINSRFFHVSADSFECVGDSVNLVQVHGTVDSDKLRGQGSEANGSIVQFVCRKISAACE